MNNCLAAPVQALETAATRRPRPDHPGAKDGAGHVRPKQAWAGITPSGDKQCPNMTFGCAFCAQIPATRFSVSWWTSWPSLAISGSVGTTTIGVEVFFSSAHMPVADTSSMTMSIGIVVGGFVLVILTVPAREGLSMLADIADAAIVGAVPTT